ncbi:hypothetical protein ACF1BS_03240 [Streptomyces sp. NPDC014748]|uniref:hypothetical protein n=1 Tax=Streptomyces sp. NPDC014748 TaxID=3364905 RepID=UPI0036FB6586
MNAALRFAYQHIPSFRREAGGTHALYVAVHSRVYTARMRHLHRRGRHSRPSRYGLDPRCQWCGTTVAR